MTYLLDTDTVISVLRGTPVRVRERLASVLADDQIVQVSTVTIFELWYGLARSQHRRANTELVRHFLAGKIETLPFGEADAQIAGKIRADLERKGQPIGPYDTLIAAQALRADDVLATSNGKEFSRLSELRLEDWRSDES